MNPKNTVYFWIISNFISSDSHFKTKFLKLKRYGKFEEFHCDGHPTYSIQRIPNKSAISPIVILTLFGTVTIPVSVIKTIPLSISLYISKVSKTSSHIYHIPFDARIHDFSPTSTSKKKIGFFFALNRCF